MKRISLCLLAVALLSVASCSNNTDTNADCIEVRLLTQICGNAVLQVISGYQALNLETWTDNNGQVHQNTFSTFMDPCAEGYPENLEIPFYITFADEPVRTSCIVCLALPSNMPQTYIDIDFVGPCNLNQLD